MYRPTRIWRPLQLYRLLMFFCILILVKYNSTQVIDIHALEILIRRTDNGTSDKYVTSVLEAYGKLADNISGRLVVMKKIPPALSRSDAVFLYVEPLPYISVNEVEQSIHVSHITDIRWYDPNMKWDPALYNNISEIEIASSSIWTPRLTLPKNIWHGALTLPDHVTLTSDGFLITSVSGHMDTFCHLDLTYFPFDEHKCTIVFMGESSFKLLPDTSRRHVDVNKHFRDGSEWILLHHACVSKQEVLTYLECFVSIRRRSSFYVANLIVPMLFTSAMTLIVFWVPAESGEKIPFLVSVFVSCSVFLNYIVETLPRSMMVLPHINALLIFVVVKVLISTAATTVVLCRYTNYRLLQQETQLMSERTYDKKMKRKQQQINMSCHDLPASLANIYTNSCHTRGLENKDVFNDDQDKSTIKTGCVGRWNMSKVVLWYRSLSHNDLDKLFFAFLASVTLVVYSILLVA